MDRLRRMLPKVLPGWWWRRIDLENESIRREVAGLAARIRPGIRILDAGSGQCRYRNLFDHAHYVGVDFGRGEHHWDYSGLDVVGHLEELPFADGSFDGVLCTQVLEHLAEPEAVLRELRRVTCSGGRLLLTAPLGFGEHQVPHDYFRYTRYGLRHLLEKAGWRIERIEPRGGYFRYMAVMMMWTYLYLFPESRPRWVKILLAPLQMIATLVFIIIGAPAVQAFDGLDRERCITLGFVAECIREADLNPENAHGELV